MASLAASSLVFAEINPAYSAELLRQATSLYLEITATANLGRYSDVTFTGCRQNTDPIVVSSILGSLHRKSSVCPLSACCPPLLTIWAKPFRLAPKH